jgi:hypothetical protein
MSGWRFLLAALVVSFTGRAALADGAALEQAKAYFRAGGRHRTPAKPDALPRGCPSRVMVRPRPRNEGEYPAHRTRCQQGDLAEIGDW